MLPSKDRERSGNPFTLPTTHAHASTYTLGCIIPCKRENKRWAALNKISWGTWTTLKFNSLEKPADVCAELQRVTTSANFCVYQPWSHEFEDKPFQSTIHLDATTFSKLEFLSYCFYSVCLPLNKRLLIVVPQTGPECWVWLETKCAEEILSL